MSRLSLTPSRHRTPLPLRSVVTAVLALQLPAQIPPPPLQGRILDPAHSPIPGAQITVSTSAVPPVTADPAGGFSITLPSGTHTLKIIADRFEQQTVTVISPATELLEVILQVAPVHSAITVSEDAGYLTALTSTATRTLTPLSDVPQSVTIVSRELIRDQMLMSISEVVRYMPGVTSHQGENNRDQVIIRGNSSSADFFVNGIRDDVQYYRDLYNVERVEAVKGSNAMIFGRGGGGGVVNRVT